MIPQPSKGKCKIIVITQTEECTDSVFYNLVFLRGMIEKYSPKTAKLRSPLIAEAEFIVENIPGTSFRFDPFLHATFKADGDFEADTEDQDLNMLYECLQHMDLCRRSLGKTISIMNR